MCTTRCFRITVILLILLILCVHHAYADYSIAPLKTIKGQLQLTVEESVNPSKKSLSIYEKELDRELVVTIEDQSNKQVKKIIWKGAIRKLEKVEFCAEGKVIAIGELPFSGSSSGGNIILVLDVKTGTVQDEIRCYSYTLSPSKRFLVYQSWYPRMILPIYRKSILLIYNITGTQASNRFQSATEYSYQNAGFPIFPEANAYFGTNEPNSLNNATKAYDVNLDNEYGVLSHFLWSDDEKQLVFFAFNMDKQTNHLVQIDLSNGVENPAIFRKFIDMNDLINWDIMLDVTKKELGKKPCRFSVESLQWAEGKGKIIVHPYQQYWLDKEIIFTLPKCE